MHWSHHLVIPSSISGNEQVITLICTMTIMVLHVKLFRLSQEDNLENYLTSQGPFICSVIKVFLSQVHMIWSACQSKLPKNIFNFTIRYINNTIPTRKNLAKWRLTSTTDCSFCLNPESLTATCCNCSCNSYLNRYTWRHDTVLNFIANILQPTIFLQGDMVDGI